MNHMYRKKIIYLLLLCLAAGMLTLCACAAPDNDGVAQPSEPLPTESIQSSADLLLSGIPGDTPIVRESPELPDTYYNVTVRYGDGILTEEWTATAQKIGDIFNCTPLIDEGIYFDQVGLMQYPTQESGTLQYSGNSVLYADPGATPSSVRESQGELTRLAVYDLNAGADMSWSYPVGGEYYSIVDAVQYVETFWAEHMQFYTTCVDHVQVGSVIVYQDQAGLCKYVLLLDKYIQGLPVEQYSAVTSIGEQGFRESFILVEMDAPEHICFYQDHYPYQVVSMEKTGGLMSSGEAVEKMNAVLADYVQYTLQEQTLKYGFFIENREMQSYGYKGTFCAKPYWCMVLEWKDSGGYTPDNYRPNVTLYIDAQTGTAYLSDMIYGTPLQISQ